MRMFVCLWLWWCSILQGCWSSDWACQSFVIDRSSTPPSLIPIWSPSPSPPTPSPLVINHSVSQTGSSDIIESFPPTPLKETHGSAKRWQITAVSPAVLEVIIFTFSYIHFVIIEECIKCSKEKRVQRKLLNNKNEKICLVLCWNCRCIFYIGLNVNKTRKK